MGITGNVLPTAIGGNIMATINNLGLIISLASQVGFSLEHIIPTKSGAHIHLKKRNYTVSLCCWTEEMGELALFCNEIPLYYGDFSSFSEQEKEELWNLENKLDNICHHKKHDCFFWTDLADEEIINVLLAI